MAGEMAGTSAPSLPGGEISYDPDLYGSNISAFSRSTRPDTVAGRYLVSVNRPVPDFNSPFCKAYQVEDVKEGRNDTHYALVFSTGLLLTSKTILALKGHAYSNLICPIEIEIVTYSTTGEQQLTAIMPKPPGISLREYIQKNGASSELQIMEQLVIPVNTLLKALEDLGINHGRINVDTVYIDKGRAILSECISEPSGYSQRMYYETLERCTVLPVAKSDTDISSDYFALGVVALEMFRGRTLAENIEDDVMLQNRLTRGSFPALTGDSELPVMMADLARGLLNDRKIDRWRTRQITDWTKGRRFSIAQSGAIEASRPLEFNGKSHLNCRSLAHDLHANWELAKRFLKEDKLLKWVERGMQAMELAEKIRFYQKMVLSRSSSQTMSDDEFVSRTLLLLEPDGPIRFREFSSSAEGLGNVLIMGFSAGKKEYIQFASRVIAARFYDHYHRTKEDRMNASSIGSVLQRCAEYVGEGAFGFGIERCLYEMNPNLSCRSDIVTKYYVATAPELLATLDSIKIDPAKPIMDRHIAAFLYSRLCQQSKIRIKGLANFPDFEMNKDIQTLSMLAFAQGECEIKKLPKLGAVMLERVEPVMALYSSKAIREEVQNRLARFAKDGDLNQMLKVFSDGSHIRRDRNGMQQAIQRYRELEGEIERTSNKRLLTEAGYNKGLQFSVILAYLICSLVVLVLLGKSI